MKGEKVVEHLPGKVQRESLPYFCAQKNENDSWLCNIYESHKAPVLSTEKWISPAYLKPMPRPGVYVIILLYAANRIKK